MVVYPTAKKVDNNCALCPTNWRFLYSYYTALEYGKTDQQYLQQIYDSKTIDDIPEKIRIQYADYIVDFLYIDDQFAIFQDVEKDAPTHFIFFPIQHIETFNILKYPDLLKSMICAANMIVKITEVDEARTSISNKSNDLNIIPHFHMHLTANYPVDYLKLKNSLYPYFYKDSEFF